MTISDVLLQVAMYKQALSAVAAERVGKALTGAGMVVGGSTVVQPYLAGRRFGHIADSEPTVPTSSLDMPVRAYAGADEFIAGLNRKSKTKLNMLQRAMLRAQFKNPHQAAYVPITPDGTKLDAFVFAGANTSPKIVAHELGHRADPNFKAIMRMNKKERVKEMLRLRSTGLHIISGKNTPLYKGEVTAWENSGVPESDPLRQAALRTYDIAGTRAGRTMLGGGLMLAGGTKGRKLLARLRL